MCVCVCVCALTHVIACMADSTVCVHMHVCTHTFDISDLSMSLIDILCVHACVQSGLRVRCGVASGLYNAADMM